MVRKSEKVSKIPHLSTNKEDMTVLLTTVFIIVTGLLVWSLLKDKFKSSKIEQLSIHARHDDKGEPVDEEELKIAMLLQIATELYDRDYIDIEIKRSGETGWIIESDVLLPSKTFNQLKRAIIIQKEI